MLQKSTNAMNQGVSPHPAAKKASCWTHTRSTSLEQPESFCPEQLAEGDSFLRWAGGGEMGLQKGNQGFNFRYLLFRGPFRQPTKEVSRQGIRVE